MAETPRIGGGADPVSPSDVGALLERILNSRHFVHSLKKKKFLSLICDYYLNGRAEELNEFRIGCEVFDRDASYNPAEDPCVRVSAHEVRRKLAAYFAGEGADEPYVLDIPLGSYRPVFSRRPPEPPAEPEGKQKPALPGSMNGEPSAGLRVRLVSVLVIVLAVLAASVFAIHSWRWTRSEGRESVWKPFLDQKQATLVVLSNPPLFRFLYKNADSVHSKEDLIPLTEAQMDAINSRAGKDPNRMPFLLPSIGDYTGVGEAISLAHIAEFFSANGKRILIKESRTASTEDLKTYNVILLGGPLSNEWVRKLGIADFDLNENLVRNRKPQAGEQSEYRVIVDQATGDPITDWALVAVMPNISGQQTVMMLAGVRGEGCQAAAEFVTNDWYLGQLQKRLAALPNPGGGRRHFQALLRVDVDNRIPTAITLVAIHPIAPNRSNSLAFLEK